MKGLFVCAALVCAVVAPASASAAAIASLSNFTTTSASVPVGQPVHLTAQLRADVDFDKTGNARLQVIDSKNQVVQNTSVDFGKLKKGQVLTLAADFTPAAGAAQGTYTLKALAASPQLNIYAQQYGLFKVTAPIIDPKTSVTVKSVTATPASAAPGQTVTLQAVVTANASMPSPGYFRLSTLSGNTILQKTDIKFAGMAKGATLTLTDSYKVPADAKYGAKLDASVSGYSAETTLAARANGVVAVTQPVAGSCAVSAVSAISILPATLCAAGTPSIVANSLLNFSWSCAGMGGGASVTCKAPKLLKAATCGEVAGTIVTGPLPTSAPLSVCAMGSRGPITLNQGTYSWNCTDTATNTNASCTASYKAPDYGIGAWEGAGPNALSNIPLFEAWLGRGVDQYMDNINQTSWQAFMTGLPWSASALPRDKRVVYAIPMLVANDYAGTFWTENKTYSNVSFPKGTLADGAAGKLDMYFTYAAQVLVKYGHGDAIIRLGWEMNGAWQPWRAAADPAAFKAFYQRIVGLMRAVPGAHFEFDWNPNIFTNEINPELVYPGDAYVDYIGLDVYDQTWNAGDADANVRWNRYLTQPNGINWWLAFGRAHGKKLSLPEWGAGGSGTHGPGDVATFMTGMAGIIKANKVSYANYWDSVTAYNGKISGGQYPKIGAAFRDAFGTR